MEEDNTLQASPDLPLTNGAVRNVQCFESKLRSSSAVVPAWGGPLTEISSSMSNAWSFRRSCPLTKADLQAASTPRQAPRPSVTFSDEVEVLEIRGSTESDGVSRRLWHTNNTSKRQATPGVPRSRSRGMDSTESAGTQRQLERVRCELAAARQQVDLREGLLCQLQLELAQAQVDDDDTELVKLEDYQVQAALETLQLKVSAQESQIKNLQLELMRAERMCQEARQSARDALGTLAETEGQAELDREELQALRERFDGMCEDHQCLEDEYDKLLEGKKADSTALATCAAEIASLHEQLAKAREHASVNAAAPAVPLVPVVHTDTVAEEEELQQQKMAVEPRPTLAEGGIVTPVHVQDETALEGLTCVTSRAMLLLSEAERCRQEAPTPSTAAQSEGEEGDSERGNQSSMGFETRLAAQSEGETGEEPLHESAAAQLSTWAALRSVTAAEVGECMGGDANDSWLVAYGLGSSVMAAAAAGGALWILSATSRRLYRRFHLVG